MGVSNVGILDMFQLAAAASAAAPTEEAHWVKYAVGLVKVYYRKFLYLLQRISVLIQRYNAILLHQSFTEENRPGQCHGD